MDISGVDSWSRRRMQTKYYWMAEGHWWSQDAIYKMISEWWCMWTVCEICADGLSVESILVNNKSETWNIHEYIKQGLGSIWEIIWMLRSYLLELTRSWFWKRVQLLRKGTRGSVKDEKENAGSYGKWFFEM